MTEPMTDEIAGAMVDYTIEQAGQRAVEIMRAQGMTPDQIILHWPKVWAALDAAAYGLAVEYTDQVEAVRGAQPTVQ